MRNLVLKSLLALAILNPQSVHAASTIVELGTPNTSTIKSVGVVPAKKFIPLNLGEIRDREPELPVVSTVKSRMKKRLRMARKRQFQVGSAKRVTGNGEIRTSAKTRPPVQSPLQSDPDFVFED